jgi:hypothetical protein
MATAIRRRDRATSSDLTPSTATRPDQTPRGNAEQTGSSRTPTITPTAPKINYDRSRSRTVDRG